MNRGLLGIFLIVFIDLLGFGIVIPILPFYAEHFGGSGLELGFLMMTYSLMQFLFAPLWGRLSDRIGRRPVLIFGLVGSAIGMTVMGLAQSLAWLYVGRLIAGISGANISTAYAYVSDITSEADRPKGMGMLGAAFGLGFTLGPAIGGMLSPYGYSTPMYFAAGLALLNAIYCTFTLKESPARAKRLEKRRSLLEVLSFRPVGVAIGLFFLFTFAIAQMEVMFGLYMGHRFGLGPKELGWIMFGVGFFMVITQGGMIGRLSKRFGTQTLIVSAFLMSALGMGAYTMMDSLWPALISLILLAIGRGILQPSLSAFVSLKTSQDDRGLTMGVFMSAASFARVVSPPIAGFLYDHFSPSTPFAFSTAVLLLGLGGAFILDTQQRDPASVSSH